MLKCRIVTLEEQPFCAKRLPLCGHRRAISICSHVEGEYELPKASHRS